MIDGFIEAIAPGTPKEALPQYNDGYQQPIIKELDLAREGIGTIIWATGYKFDFSFVKLPVFDADHFPIQKNGATEYPGLYFVGLPWMPSQKSGFLMGIADAAKKLRKLLWSEVRQLASDWLVCNAVQLRVYGRETPDGVSFFV